MTDDIVARLRSYAYADDTVYNPWVYGEAADEIERLKNQISHIIEHNNPQIEQANSYFKLLEEELARCNKIIDGYEEEHSKLRERRDDWRAAMAENHDLWRENERLRAAAEMALETLIGCCVSAGGVDDRKTILEAQDMLRAALEWEKKDDAST